MHTKYKCRKWYLAEINGRIDTLIFTTLVRQDQTHLLGCSTNTPSLKKSSTENKKESNTEYV